MMQATVLSMAALALVAGAASLLSGAAVWALARFRHGTTATAEARAVLAAAVAPAVIALGAVAIALAPSWGLGRDHCFDHGAHHAHLCFAHSLGEPGALLWVVAGLFGARLAWRSAAWGRSISLARRARRALTRARLRADGVSVIDDPEPHAFVLGWLRPRVYVTSALLTAVTNDELSAVLAHERAHRERRDPLRRLLASMALSFHLPGISGAIERRLALAHEKAADERAAREVGDRTRIAEALVRLARRRARPPAGAAALGGADVAVRVDALLAEGRRIDAPSATLLSAATALLAAGAVVLASSVHHALEHVLGFLF